MDTYHADFGAVLLKKWKFPSEYFNVARYHGDMSRADFISPELLVINFANLAVKEMGYTEMTELAAEPVARSTSCNLLKMDPEMLEDIQGQVKSRMDETSGIFR